MLVSVYRALGITLALWLMLGLGYPLIMAGISQGLFPYQASGSVIRIDGAPRALAHVGQNFTGSADYFWGRPSYTLGAHGRLSPYNPLQARANNLGATSPLLLRRIHARVRALLTSTPNLTVHAIPLSLVEGSASGLDPDITVASALIQIPRVAHATDLRPRRLRKMVGEATHPPEWGLLGPSRVNVVALNLLVYSVLHARKRPGV